MRYKLILGGIIAYILLILYSGIVIYIIMKVIACSDDPLCEIELNQGLVYVITTVGGLVSALVVSRMTITNPGADPAVFRDLGKDQPRIVNIIVWCYLLIWLFTGLAALVVGVLVFPDSCKTLSDLGTTWLGLAVAAGYAYFNIDPLK